jgi:hypothetical protein
VVKRLRAASCDANAESRQDCVLPDHAHVDCASIDTTSEGSCARLAILKVPRTGSTWLNKELRAFGIGVQLEFEPFTDPSAQSCAGRFYTQALTQAIRQRLRCVTRESRSLPCYWGWLGCNATKLKPRPYRAGSSPTSSASMAKTAMGSSRTQAIEHKADPMPGALMTGFLLNPMYAPGAIWSRVLAAQPRTRLVLLRRTNLVKMAVSDIRRLAGAAARARRSTSSSQGGERGAGSRVSAVFVEPLTLLTRLNLTLVSQATFPAGISLEQAMLVL